MDNAKLNYKVAAIELLVSIVLAVISLFHFAHTGTFLSYLALIVWDAVIGLSWAVITTGEYDVEVSSGWITILQEWAPAIGTGLLIMSFFI